MSASSAAAVAAHCQAVLRRGSRSFAWAAQLLPKDARQRAAALYAFCREADDAIDETHAPKDAHAKLVARLVRVAAGRDLRHPTDVALAQLLAETPALRVPLEALLEGFLWDAQARTYATFDETLGYCARVAASVGVAMCLILGAQAPWVLARAADLGTAMQLTNIARDVGEDARRGRVYLPDAWLHEAGLSAASLRAHVQFSPPLGAQVARLLRHAEPLYVRAALGIPALPGRVRPAVRAAAHIYRSIGHTLAELGFDSVTHRAMVPARRKSWAVMQALVGTERGWAGRAPKPAALAPALPQNAFLLAALAAS